MTAMTCTRLPEVEAARDGRLSGAERKSFERHLTVCAICRDEARKLTALGELLKSASCADVPDELANRRRRQQLLRDADQLVVNQPTTRGRAFAIPALVVAALALMFVGRSVIARRHSPAPIASTTTAAPVEIAAVQAAEGARYTRVRDGAVERIELLEGELAIAVYHATGNEHVVVKLPDGELEDLGTRFVVAVQNGHTEHVVVQEGLVVLRLRGLAPIRIAAGGSWARETTPSVVASTPASVCSTSVASAPTAQKLKPAPVAIVADTSSEELKAAMTAYRSGDHRVAAAKLAAFVQAHPADPRSEDAAYVRIVALQRAGDTKAAHVAAKDYLARYPNGFRKPEVEGMLSAN